MLSNYGKWSSSPQSGHSRVGFKNPLTAIGLDYGDHSAAHVPSPLGALESSFADVSRVCDVWPCAILRAVGAGDGRGRRAAPLFAKRLRFKVCRKAPCRAHLRSVHTGKKIARGVLSRRARINKVASTIGRRHVSLPRVRTLNTSVRHVPQAQRCLSRNATQFKGHATVGTKR